MKIVLFSIEITLCFLTFVLPSILAVFNNEALANALCPQFSMAGLLVFIIALMFLWSKKELYKEIFKGKSNIIKTHSVCLICLGLLFLSGTIFEGAAWLLKVQQDIDVILPAGVVKWISFFAAVVMAAVTEEIIFRFYLIEYLLLFTGRKLYYFKEGTVILIFASCHLYLGLFAFLNALVCGIILRICIKKTQSLTANCIVHIIYNLLTFIASAVL